MFNFIKDREQEKDLLYFAKEEAACNKHNILEAMKLEDDVKPNGEIHKTKMKTRTTIINSWKKENKKLKDFFLKHRKAKGKDDYKHYKFRAGVTDGRDHLKDRGN